MFLGADTWLALHDHPPSFVSHLGVAYPHVPASLVRETRATLQFRVDADAVAYFLAVPVGFAALNRTVPTSAEVREGTNGPVGTFGRDGLVSGSIDVAAGETASANVTNLTEASSSDVWVTAATRNGTLQSHVSLVDVRTRDMTPPGFLPVDVGGASAPRLFVGARSVDVASRLTEPGAAFLVVQSQETQAPTAARIRARALAGESGTCAVNATVATRVYGCGVFDLLEVTNHSAFYTVEDAPEFTSPNLLETPFRFDFRTRDATPRRRGAHPGRRAGGRLRRPRAIDQERNGPLGGGSGGAPAPTFEEVRAGVARGGLAPVASGRVDIRGASANLLGAASRALPVGAANGTVAVVRLHTETAYDLHAVFADDQNANDPGVNFNATVISLARVVTARRDGPARRRPRRRKRHVRRVHARPHRRRTREGTLRGGPRWRPAPTPFADAPTPEEVVAGTGRRRSARRGVGRICRRRFRRRPRRGSNRRRRRRESSRARRMRERWFLRRERGRVDRGGARRRRELHRDGHPRRRRLREFRRRGAAASEPRYGGEDGDGVAVPSLPSDPTVLSCACVLGFRRRGRTTCGWWRRMMGTIPRRTRRRVGTARRRLAGRIGFNARPRAKTVGVADPRAPSFVVADARAPSIAVNLTANNASFATLRVSLDEAGAAAFALRHRGRRRRESHPRRRRRARGMGPDRRAARGGAETLAPGARAGILRVDRKTESESAAGLHERVVRVRRRISTRRDGCFASPAGRGRDGRPQHAARRTSWISSPWTWNPREDRIRPRARTWATWSRRGRRRRTRRRRFGWAPDRRRRGSPSAPPRRRRAPRERDSSSPRRRTNPPPYFTSSRASWTGSSCRHRAPWTSFAPVAVILRSSSRSGARSVTASESVVGNFTCATGGAGDGADDGDGCSHARVDTPLAQGAAYVAWFVAVDASPAMNRQSSPTRVAFIAEDAVPPSSADPTARRGRPRRFQTRRATGPSTFASRSRAQVACFGW